MKYIDKPYIKKTYEFDPQELVMLRLEDVRDNYVEENALGKIGYISIGKGYLSFVAEYDEESKISEKETALMEAYKEIFGRREIDSTSNIHYVTIKGMIADGTLETLGYEQEKALEQDEDYNVDYLNGYNPRRR